MIILRKRKKTEIVSKGKLSRSRKTLRSIKTIIKKRHLKLVPNSKYKKINSPKIHKNKAVIGCSKTKTYKINKLTVNTQKKQKTQGSTLTVAQLQIKIIEKGETGETGETLETPQTHIKHSTIKNKSPIKDSIAKIFRVDKAKNTTEEMKEIKI